MDLFSKLVSDSDLIESFCDILEEAIEETKNNPIGFSPNITYKITDESIFFFIDSSSILQIIPDKELQYTYANVPGYGNEIKKSIDKITLLLNRDEKLDKLLNKKRE